MLSPLEKLVRQKIRSFVKVPSLDAFLILADHARMQNWIPCDGMTSLAKLENCSLCPLYNDTVRGPCDIFIASIPEIEAAWEEKQGDIVLAFVRLLILFKGPRHGGTP